MVKKRNNFIPVFESGSPPNLGDPESIVPIRPIIYQDQEYKPPGLKPHIREEAIYLLARGGFNALEVPAHLIRAFSFVFHYRKRIQNNGYGIEWQGDVYDAKIKANTDSLVMKWVNEKPMFFSGLPEMGGWLQQACCLLGFEALSYRCAQKQVLESATRVDYTDLNSSLLDDLASDLDDIAESCTLAWNFDIYLKLILHYAESVKSSSGQNHSESTLKKKLLEQLEGLGIFQAHTRVYSHGNPDEWERDSSTDVHISGIHDALENCRISYAMFINQIRSLRGLATDTSNEVPNDFLRSDKHFSREFFIWFCIAYVEVILASAEDSEAAPQRITSWAIYQKMRELNNGNHIAPVGQEHEKDEKESKSQVTNLISHCKKRLKDNSLPVPQGSPLAKKYVAQYVEFFQKIPEISKYFTRTKFAQQIVSSKDTKAIEH